ncbi:hypothetical protein [Paenarthrobacter sp. NPDC058040]|uniref:hypothetical protein n=1 Tax=unclassified Paenarthrobacter TaxID=2634190 RepID=UPI0036D772A4
MRTDILTAVCTAASTPSLRILRALNLLQIPQRLEEIAEGLELCPSIVAGELSKLERAGIVRTCNGEVRLSIDLNSLFGNPLMPAKQPGPARRGDDADV